MHDLYDDYSLCICIFLKAICPLATKELMTFRSVDYTEENAYYATERWTLLCLSVGGWVRLWVRFLISLSTHTGADKIPVMSVRFFSGFSEYLASLSVCLRTVYLT